MDKDKKVTVDWQDISMAGSIAIAHMSEDIVEEVGARNAMCILTAIIAKLLVDDIDLVRAKIKKEATNDGED